MSLLSDRISVLRLLVEKYGTSVSSEERILAGAVADALDAADKELSLLREQVESLVTFSQEMSADLGELEEALADGDFEDGDFETEDSDEEDFRDEGEDPDSEEWEVDEKDLIEYQCPDCGTFLFFTPTAFEMEDGRTCPTCGYRLFKEDVVASDPE